jgi:hypothetical protein
MPLAMQLIFTPMIWQLMDRKKQHFQDNPSVFAKFNSNQDSATPFVVPKDASEQFLRSNAP